MDEVSTGRAVKASLGGKEEWEGLDKNPPRPVREAMAGKKMLSFRQCWGLTQIQKQNYSASSFPDPNWPLTDPQIKLLGAGVTPSVPETVTPWHADLGTTPGTVGPARMTSLRPAHRIFSDTAWGGVGYDFLSFWFIWMNPSLMVRRASKWCHSRCIFYMVKLRWIKEVKGDPEKVKLVQSIFTLLLSGVMTQRDVWTAPILPEGLTWVSRWYMEHESPVRGFVPKKSWGWLCQKN